MLPLLAGIQGAGHAAQPPAFLSCMFVLPLGFPRISKFGNHPCCRERQAKLVTDAPFKLLPGRRVVFVVLFHAARSSERATEARRM